MSNIPSNDAAQPKLNVYSHLGGDDGESEYHFSGKVPPGSYVIVKDTDYDKLREEVDRLRALVAAGNRLDSAMDMQEQRESGAFHLSQQAAAGVWKDARRLWVEAVEQALSAPAAEVDDEAARRVAAAAGPQGRGRMSGYPGTEAWLYLHWTGEGPRLDITPHRLDCSFVDEFGSRVSGIPLIRRDRYDRLMAGIAALPESVKTIRLEGLTPAQAKIWDDAYNECLRRVHDIAAELDREDVRS